MTTDQFGPVRDGNRPRRTATRPDPDTPTTTAPAPGHALAPQDGGALVASKLASKQSTADGTGQDTGGASPTLTVRQMLQLRRTPKDPYNDWVADGTRTLSWVQDAIALVAAMTNRTQQEVQRDALLGIQPLPEEILDATFADRFGYARSKTSNAPPHQIP